MTDPSWEEVDIPRGAYFSWGNEPGQKILGKVLSFKADGGMGAPTSMATSARCLKSNFANPRSTSVRTVKNRSTLARSRCSTPGRPS